MTETMELSGTVPLSVVRSTDWESRIDRHLCTLLMTMRATGWLDR